MAGAGSFDRLADEMAKRFARPVQAGAGNADDKMVSDHEAEIDGVRS